MTWGGFITRPEETVAYLAPHVRAGICQPFLAYVGPTAAGCVSPRVNASIRVGYLDGGVHVLPAYRRQGIGRALLSAALAWLREKGMVAAEVRPFNPAGEDAVVAARRFYLACGGEVVAEHPTNDSEAGYVR